MLFLITSLCSIAVTVTALHPTRLCRIAVFSIKPTFSHKHPDGGVLALISQCDFALSYLWVYPLGLGSCFFPFLIYAKYDLADHIGGYARSYLV